MSSSATEQQNPPQSTSASASTNSVPDHYALCFKKYELLIEYKNLINPRHCPSSIYVLPSLPFPSPPTNPSVSSPFPSSPSPFLPNPSTSFPSSSLSSSQPSANTQQDFKKWYAVFFPHSGPYKSGVFKFVITFPNDYPDSPPRIFFLTEMFHPLVDAISKEFEYLRVEDWKSWLEKDKDEDKVKERSKRAKFTVTKLLRYLKKCFSENGLKALKAEECVNIDAWKFYNNEHSTYIQLASQFAQQSLTNGTLYDHYTDDNSIRFSELSDERFEQLKSQISERKPSKVKGLNVPGFLTNMMR